MTSPVDAFSADRPITLPTEDKLGRVRFAARIAEAIWNWRGKDSLVIALYGPWGSGKSSVKNLVLDSLKPNYANPQLLIEFNPWYWSGHDKLFSAFFVEIGKVLSTEAGSSEQKQQVAERWARYARGIELSNGVVKGLSLIAPLIAGPAGTVATSALQTTLERVNDVVSNGAKAFKGDAESKPLNELKRELAESLAALSVPLVVVIDDIDRLTPSEVSQVFQLIKANADFPNIVYLLLMQRDSVENALNSVLAGKGREYLEKMVQVGLDIPNPNANDLRSYMTTEVQRIVPPSAWEGQAVKKRWEEAFSIAMSVFIKNMRDAKRFLSSYSFHLGMFRRGAQIDINCVDLFLVEMLRVFAPSVYDVLNRSRSSMTFSVPDLIRGKVPERQISQALRAEIEKTYPGISGHIAFSTVTHLFPTDRTVIEAWPQWYIERRICHPEMVDRYFSLLLPSQEWGREDIERLLNCLQDQDAFTKMMKQSISDGSVHSGLECLWTHRSAITERNADSALCGIFNIGDELPLKASRDGNALLELVHRLAVKCIWQFPAEERLERLKAVIERTHGLILPLHVVLEYWKYGRSLFQAGPSARPVDFQEFNLHLRSLSEVNVLKESLVGKLGRIANDADLGQQARLLRVLGLWAELEPDQPREWLTRLLDRHEGVLAVATAVSSMPKQMPQAFLGEAALNLGPVLATVPSELLLEKISTVPATALNDAQRQLLQDLEQQLR